MKVSDIRSLVKDGILSKEEAKDLILKANDPMDVESILGRLNNVEQQLTLLIQDKNSQGGF